MGYLGRLLVLSLLVSAVVAQGGKRNKGRRRRPSARPPSTESMETGDMELYENLKIMNKADCLPGDFNSGDLSVCDGESTKKEKFECLAKRAGFATESGYNQVTSEIFIDSRSEDEEWTARAKNLMSICSDRLPEDLPANNQGVFVFTCWYMLEKLECNQKRAADLLAKIAGDDGRLIGQWLAYVTEGSCISFGMKNQKSEEKWNECAQDTELDFKILLEAGGDYKKFVSGSNDVETPTPQEVAEVGKQLLNFNDTVHCTMQAIGEITDGVLDFNLMPENIKKSRGKDYIKKAAMQLLEYCEAQKPTSPDMFVNCWFINQPYACAILKTHGFLLSSEENGGCGAGAARRQGGNNQRRRNFRRGSGNRRRNPKRKQPQGDEVMVDGGR